MLSETLSVEVPNLNISEMRVRAKAFSCTGTRRPRTRICSEKGRSR
jgi:hypothetical protein